jgi:hypothetical protein
MRRTTQSVHATYIIPSVDDLLDPRDYAEKQESLLTTRIHVLIKEDTDAYLAA